MTGDSEIRELREALEKAKRRIAALKRVSRTRKLRYERAEAELARLNGTWGRRATGYSYDVPGGWQSQVEWTDEERGAVDEIIARREFSSGYSWTSTA